MEQQLFDIPVLLITFNRPETTARVFDRIKALKPQKLYIFSDAARPGKPVEQENVARCLNLFNEKNITWPCEVHRWFAPANMGCGNAVSSAISWMFASESYGIILEDDCLPHPTFFNFCSAMLKKYADDEHVMHIAGTRWNDDFNIGEGDHFFSRIGHIWGWATWKRAWDKYDYNMSGWDALTERPALYRQLKKRAQTQFWIENFVRIFNKPTAAKDTWDYQWQYTLFKNNALAVVPRVNLITNIGIEGAHTNPNDADQACFNRPTTSWSCSHTSSQVKANTAFDTLHIADYFMKDAGLLRRAKWYIKSFI